VSAADQPLDVAGLQARLRAFSDERGWEPYQTPKNLAMAMVVEAAELVEIFQWMTPEASTRVAEHPQVQQHLGEEIADAMVYLLQIADRCGIDIAQAIDRKIALNALKYPAGRDSQSLSAAKKLASDAG
jgi:NTP pyrophosphatase (non-canonical NTP hydrolase)